MKPGRSNQFTTGICNTFEGTDLKVLFFELDHFDPITGVHMSRDLYHDQVQRVKDVYRFHMIDYMTHKTQNGIHFLSPTMMEKKKWKSIISEIKDLNTKCPMNTLRIKPNKYPNEKEFWYRFSKETFAFNEPINSWNMCNYLNKIFGETIFKGNPEMGFELKIVNYPLPEKR